MQRNLSKKENSGVIEEESRFTDNDEDKTITKSMYRNCRRRKRRGDYFVYRVASILFALGCIYIYSIFTASSAIKSSDYHRSRRSTDELLLTDNMTHPDVDEHHENCSEPAYKEFPDDHMSEEVRHKGGILVHVLVSIYMFAGIAIVCDDYFVPALEKIVEKLGLSDDVAGATFMAAGSSAPELFTSVIGVFVAKGDVGIGTIVGSAVFNVLVIIGLCALLCDQPTQLSWWPLFRDSSYYLVSIGILIGVMWDSEITWWEAMIMLIFYIGYIVIMKFNKNLKGLISKDDEKDEDNEEKIPMNQSIVKNQENGNGQVVNLKTDEEASKPDSSSTAEGDEDDDEEGSIHPFQPPSCTIEFIKWCICWPLLFLMFITIPNCNTKRFEKFFIVSFIMSTVWIAAYSYMMVWMVCLIGYTVGVADTIMGITFLAAGTSIPDTIASVMVARDGHGDMAVSNSIGSNVFDILLGLGLPWFLSTTIKPNGAGDTVHINSNGLMISVSLLLFSLIFVVVGIRCNGWRLTKPLGVAIMVVYALFLAISILIETNTFFIVNLPTCA